MSPRGRFAPSPTGTLHFGSWVTALASWLHVRRAGGAWLLRIDDLDPPRTRPGSAAALGAALHALGLDPDAPILCQSRRGDAYAAALEMLRAQGHAFPCWCTRGDIAASGHRHLDGRCTHAPEPDRVPTWRIRVPDVAVAFDDVLQGPRRQNVRAEVGDFVVRRADGEWSYQLASVVDDAFLGITEVVRGVDLLDSTPRQILLQRMLGLPTPSYLHLPLAVNAAGEKLAKSSGAPTVDVSHPRAIIARALRFLGQPVPAEGDPARLLEAAAAAFDPAPLRGVRTRVATDIGTVA